MRGRVRLDELGAVAFTVQLEGVRTQVLPEGLEVLGRLAGGVVRQEVRIGLRFDQARIDERVRVGSQAGRGGRVGRAGVGAVEGCRGIGAGQVAREVRAALVEEHHVVVLLDRLGECIPISHGRLDAG